MDESSRMEGITAYPCSSRVAFAVATVSAESGLMGRDILDVAAALVV